MIIAELLSRMEAAADREALVTDEAAWTYRSILARSGELLRVFDEKGLRAGDPVSLVADYHGDSIATLIALLKRNAFISLIPDIESELQEPFLRIVEPRWVLRIGHQGGATITSRQADPQIQPLHAELLARGHAGLVMFSSGSERTPKAVVHDFHTFLTRFDQPSRPSKGLAFMQFDHVGGIYNLFSSLFNQGTLHFSQKRDPDLIAALIERHRIEFFPMSASYMNLMVLQKPWLRHDLSSLKAIVYGSERPSEHVVRQLSAALPGVTLHQNYGLTEVCLLRSKSRSRDSTWLRITDPMAQVRVVDGKVQVRSALTMLGYLNAPHSVTPDGWYETGDLAEQDGEWIRVLGRSSQMISVGGRKVSPEAVEEVLQQIPGVADVVVNAVPNPLLGQSVRAVFQLTDPGKTDPREFRMRVRAFCADRLKAYEAPSQIEISEEALMGRRLKKRRTLQDR